MTNIEGSQYNSQYLLYLRNITHDQGKISVKNFIA